MEGLVGEREEGEVDATRFDYWRSLRLLRYLMSLMRQPR